MWPTLIRIPFFIEYICLTFQSAGRWISKEDDNIYRTGLIVNNENWRERSFSFFKVEAVGNGFNEMEEEEEVHGFAR